MHTWTDRRLVALAALALAGTLAAAPAATAQPRAGRRPRLDDAPDFLTGSPTCRACGATRP